MAKRSSPRRERISAAIEQLNVGGDLAVLVKAFGELLDAALPAEKPVKAELTPKVYTARDLHQYMLANLTSNKLDVTTYTQTDFVRLNNKLAGMSLRAEDPEVLTAWINGGGLEWLARIQTWGNLVTYYERWLASARNETPKNDNQYLLANVR